MGTLFTLLHASIPFLRSPTIPWIVRSVVSTYLPTFLLYAVLSGGCFRLRRRWVNVVVKQRLRRHGRWLVSFFNTSALLIWSWFFQCINCLACLQEFFRRICNQEFLGDRRRCCHVRVRLFLFFRRYQLWNRRVTWYNAWDRSRTPWDEPVLDREEKPYVTVNNRSP